LINLVPRVFDAFLPSTWPLAEKAVGKQHFQRRWKFVYLVITETLFAPARSYGARAVSDSAQSCNILHFLPCMQMSKNQAGPRPASAVWLRNFFSYPKIFSKRSRREPNPQSQEPNGRLVHSKRALNYSKKICSVGRAGGIGPIRPIGPIGPM
jgi:hypothetical protein